MIYSDMKLNCFQIGQWHFMFDDRLDVLFSSENALTSFITQMNKYIKTISMGNCFYYINWVMNYYHTLTRLNFDMVNYLNMMMPSIFSRFAQRLCTITEIRIYHGIIFNPPALLHIYNTLIEDSSYLLGNTVTEDDMVAVFSFTSTNKFCLS